jgi:type I restriction enzyme M protein
MTKDRNNGSAAHIGSEDHRWRAAHALRSNMDAAEHKHVVLGLIIVRYISDAFEEQHVCLDTERAQGADPEGPDEYRAVNIFWVPQEARWSHLLANTRQPTIGKLVDEACSPETTQPSNGQRANAFALIGGKPGLDKTPSCVYNHPWR